MRHAWRCFVFQGLAWRMRHAYTKYMTTNPAAARLARIAATLTTHEAAVAFTRQERETLSDLCGWAFFNGGRSAELQEAVDAFKEFCRTCPALQVDTAAA